MDKAVLTYDKTVERTFFNLIYSSYLADTSLTLFRGTISAIIIISSFP